MVSPDAIKQTLIGKLQATDVEVVDISGGCGASFEVYVTSPIFEGQKTIQRHRAINTALEELMKDIHALSIKKCKTPAELATAAAT